MSRFSVVLIFICIALAGLAFLPLLPVKLEPSYTLPKLTVSYSMPGHSSRIIEIEVTSRLEAMLARIRGIREIRSTSGNDWGRIVIELDRHADPDAIRFEASTIVRRAWSILPEGLSYPTIEMSRPDDKEARPFMSFVINAASTPILIQQFAERRIKPALAGIPGIYRVDITGATPMEWRLDYDSRRLALLGINVEDIRGAIIRKYQKEALGIVQDEAGQWIRLALVPEASPEGFDPSRISVMTPGGPIGLDRLLKVSRREAPPSAYYRINGLNSVYLFINAEETANQLELASRINQEMKTIRDALPAGYEMHISYDATRFIREELNKIYVRTAMTIAILLLFVLIMTRSWRYLALIVVSLAVNICIAFIFYYLFRLEMQLYSLAGITISLSLIIDNVIVMSDHIRNKHNRNAFLPILAATLTTIGALCIIFFLDNSILLNLQDFTMVVIINLAVSLFIALFFIPALQPSLMPSKDRPLSKRRMRLSRLTVLFGRFYLMIIHFTSRWKGLLCAMLVLAFGLPVFMLPGKIDMKAGKKYSPLDSTLIVNYNKAVSVPIYKEKIKPIADVALGGALRPFAQNAYRGIYVERKQETVLSLTASMPNGTTLAQMNSLIRRMESYISSQGDNLRQFQTRIFSAREARIDILFTKESERTGYPYMLKQNLIGKALELGGGSWSVFGLPDPGFNNDVREFAGSYRVELLGYNYDELYGYSEALRDSLLTNKRIKEIHISHEFSWYKNDYQEMFFQLNKRNLAAAGLIPINFFSTLRSLYGSNIPSGSIIVGNRLENLRLNSQQSSSGDVWTLLNAPLSSNSLAVGHLAQINKAIAPQNIAKLNQQYVLSLQYEYIGANRQGERFLERTLDNLNNRLPIGYTAKVQDRYNYLRLLNESQPYALLPVIILILYFISGILFNSLRQPLAIIFVIPISYIGVFIAFKQFRLHFDQGGFASFVLLCGITINAGIYILNEYNNIRRRKPRMPLPRAYLKAWNAKIGPIFLTIISSVLGFIPFLVGVERENFWFSLAAGSISGLITSFAGIFLCLPMFCGLRNKIKIEKS